MVKSQIIEANGELVKVDYMMRLNGDSWLICDIYLHSATVKWLPPARSSPPS
jgi:hypothetical protein